MRGGRPGSPHRKRATLRGRGRRRSRFAAVGVLLLAALGGTACATTPPVGAPSGVVTPSEDLGAALARAGARADARRAEDRRADAQRGDAPARVRSEPPDSVALPVPDPEWTLRRLDGSTFTLGELRGRPVFVNFWATWCPPCVAELASIGVLAERLADTEVAFVLVSSEDADAVRRFTRRESADPLPVLEETLAPEAFGALVLPTTAILDGEGRLLLLHRGAEDWAVPAVEDLLRRLDRGGGP